MSDEQLSHKIAWKELGIIISLVIVVWTLTIEILTNKIEANAKSISSIEQIAEDVEIIKEIAITNRTDLQWIKESLVDVL